MVGFTLRKDQNVRIPGVGLLLTADFLVVVMKFRWLLPYLFFFFRFCAQRQVLRHQSLHVSLHFAISFKFWLWVSVIFVHHPIYIRFYFYNEVFLFAASLLFFYIIGEESLVGNRAWSKVMIMWIAFREKWTSRKAVRSSSILRLLNVISSCRSRSPKLHRMTRHTPHLLASLAVEWTGWCDAAGR